MEVSAMNKKTSFGNYFQHLRHSRNLTITQAAKLLNVSITYISLVEKGDRSIPSTWRKKIIEAFKLTDEEIILLDQAICSTPFNKTITLKEIETVMSNMIENCTEDEDTKSKIRLLQI